MSVSPSWFFRAAVVYGLIAMALGIHMAASGDHVQMPTHAHLNLVGWVTIFLFGVFLKLHPGANGRLSMAIWWIANAGMIVMAVGLYIIFSGDLATGEPFATIGSILTILAMAIFAVVVFRTRD